MKRHLPAHCYQKGEALYFQRRGYPTARVKSKPGTKEFALEYAAFLNGSPKVAPTRQTFAALIKRYRQSTKYTSKAQRTRKDYDEVLDWMEAKIGTFAVSAYKRKHVIAAQTANTKRIRFANYTVQVTRILLEYAIDLGWIETNPARNVSLLPTPNKKEREAWPNSLIEAFRKEAPERARLIFELCLGTGQRIGDVLKMRWNDIDPATGALRVTQNKTRKALYIPMTDDLAAILSKTPRRGLTIVTQENHGKPLSYRSAHEDIMAVRKAIGATEYDIHSLRYTTARDLAALGLSDDIIMAVTGHSTREMVVKYAGEERQKQRAIIAQNARNKTK